MLGSSSGQGYYCVKIVADISASMARGGGFINAFNLDVNA